MNSCATLEPLGHQLAQAPDAERLGRVVAGRDEVDAALAGIGHRVLGRLSGQERVEAQLDRPRGSRGAPARYDRRSTDPLRAGVEDERLAPGMLGDAVEQLRRLERRPDGGRSPRSPAP